MPASLPPPMGTCTDQIHDPNTAYIASTAAWWLAPMKRAASAFAATSLDTRFLHFVLNAVAGAASTLPLFLRSWEGARESDFEAWHGVRLPTVPPPPDRRTCT